MVDREARNIWQLAGTTAAVWLLCGVAFSAITTLAGLFASKDERGRVLGVIGMSRGLAGIIGGLSVGPIVDRWGYPTMFLALSLFSIALLMSAIFVRDKKIERIPNRDSSMSAEKPSFGKAFYILLLATLIATTIQSLAGMGRSLSMNNLDFSATAITSTQVVSGVVSLPFPFVFGWLSDRLGRKRMMIVCYLSFALCMAILAISKSLWHFWIAVILYRAGRASMTVGAAFAADLVEPKALGRSVSLFQGMGWIAFAIGYVVAGNAFQAFGITATSLFSTALPIIGIILIMSIRVAKQKEVAA